MADGAEDEVEVAGPAHTDDNIDMEEAAFLENKSKANKKVYHAIKDKKTEAYHGEKRRQVCERHIILAHRGHRHVVPPQIVRASRLRRRRRGI